MRPIRAVLIDIDGVLTVSWKPLPGAVAALQWLCAAAFPLALVTNTTSRTRASIASALAEAGFPVSVGDILTAPVIAAAYLQDHYPGARCLLLSSGDIGQDLAGLTLARENDQHHRAFVIHVCCSSNGEPRLIRLPGIDPTGRAEWLVRALTLTPP